MTQIEATAPYTLPTPSARLDRAISDYLFTSRRAKTLYFNDEDYLIAEESAWKKLQEALLDHPEYNLEI